MPVGYSHSLTVAPSHFKQGLASKLLTFVLSEYSFTQASVETAAANLPAIKLYEKHGFLSYKEWVPSHGIREVALGLHL